MELSWHLLPNSSKNCYTFIFLSFIISTEALMLNGKGHTPLWRNTTFLGSKDQGITTTKVLQSPMGGDANNNGGDWVLPTVHFRQPNKQPATAANKEEFSNWSQTIMYNINDKGSKQPIQILKIETQKYNETQNKQQNRYQWKIWKLIWKQTWIQKWMWNGNKDKTN